MVKIDPNKAAEVLKKAENSVKTDVKDVVSNKMREASSEEALKNAQDAQASYGKAALKKYEKPETEIVEMESEKGLMAGSGNGAEGDDVVHDEDDLGGGGFINQQTRGLWDEEV